MAPPPLLRSGTPEHPWMTSFWKRGRGLGTTFRSRSRSFLPALRMVRYTARMNDFPGILIAIDGIDGAGKTTQVRLLERVLLDAGETVLVSKEPTDGQWGQVLRDSAITGRLPADQELETFILDRQDHLVRKVTPALQAGNVVILDRYFYSTIAYQGLLQDDYRTIESKIRANVVVPDLAFWLDLPAEIAVGRVTARDGSPNLFERQDDLARAGEIFRMIAAVDKTLIRLDGTLPILTLHQMALSQVVDGPLQRKRCAKPYGCADAYYCTPRITGTCGWWKLKHRLTGAGNTSESETR